MGNEASLEGGEGLGAFPEGAAAAAGDGGGPAAPLQRLVPAGVEADLSQLSEEERRQIAAVMSRAQGLPRGNLAGAEPPSMQRHARKIALLPPAPFPVFPVSRGGAGGESRCNPGPLHRERALRFAACRREGGGRHWDRAHSPAFSSPLRGFLLITAVIGSSGLRPFLFPPVTPIRSTGTFCALGGGDLQPTFRFSLCVCVCALWGWSALLLR